MEKEDSKITCLGADFKLCGNALIVSLKEDLDHHNAVAIREKADRLLKREGVRHVIFDFTGVDFMDSSGIGVIMGRYKQVIFTGGKAAVCGIGAAVDRIFKMSGLYKIIERYETADAAVKALAKRA